MTEQDSEFWYGLIFGFGIISMLFILVLVVVWQGFAVWRARASVAREEAYQALAERSANAQHRSVEEQQRIADELGQLRTHVAAMEKMLREVG